MKKVTVLAGVILAVILALAGCRQSTSSHLKAAASSTAVQQDKQTAAQLIQPCIPASQVRLIIQLSHVKGWEKFANCIGVPKSTVTNPNNRQDFENAALKAAENTPHVLSKGEAGKTARHTYLNTTLPKLVQQYRSK